MEKVLGLLDLHSDRDLGALTQKRCIASTSFLGRYAFMDFALSNFANSNIDEVGILVRDHLRSLIQHLGSGHAFNGNTKLGSITLLYDEPYSHNLGYNHDVNNLLENKWLLERSNAKTVVISVSSIIAKIDYRDYIAKHHASGNKISMIYAPIKNARNHFIDRDVLSIEDGIVKSIKSNRGTEDYADISISSVIVDKDYLCEMINQARDTSAFFSLRDIITNNIVKQEKITALPFEGYVTYFDSLSSYLTQSLELLKPEICSNLFTDLWPIYTKTYDTPPTIYGKNAKVSNSFIANGAKIDGTVTNSIIGRNVKIRKGARINNSIILTDCEVGEDCNLDYVIVDKQAKIIFIKELIGTSSDPVFIKREDIV